MGADIAGMQRRKLLRLTVSATAVTAIAGCTQDSDRDDDGTGTETTDRAEGDSPGAGGQTDDGTDVTDSPSPAGSGSGGQSASGSAGQMNGVSFSFSTQGGTCGEGADNVDISFDTETNEVVLDGTISGSDSCKTAELDAVTYDDGESKLTVDIVTRERDACKDGDTMAQQCLVDIPYEGTFDLVDQDSLPDEVSVSHDGQGIAGAAHESARVTARDT